MRKFPKILVSLLLVCSLLCGCNAELPDIEVTAGDLTITLPGYFKNYYTEASDIFFMYGYGEITIGGFRDDYSNYDELPTPEEYAAKMIADNELVSEVEVIDGLVTFSFPKMADNTNTSYTYLTVIFAGSDAFWSVQASVSTLNYKVTRDQLLDIIKTTVVK